MTGQEYKSLYKNSWALVIGINNYKCAPHLEYACNDADAVADVLKSSLGFPQEQVIVLKDATATRSRILEAYLDFHKTASDPDGRVLVFFAGHGQTLKNVGFLVPVDGKKDTLHTLIRWDDLTRNADLIEAKHILFIMDACYSGLAMRRVSPPLGQRFLSDMLQRRARQVITAGKADETVADGGGPKGQNSIFTGYLLEGLSGKAANQEGILTANGLMHYVYEKVAQGPRSSQTPHYGHIDGDADFVLLGPGLQHLKSGSFSDVLVADFVRHPEPSAESSPVGRSLFATTVGYGDPTHASFGRNDLSVFLMKRKRDILNFLV